MFKSVILLTRADNISEAEFREWYLSEHGPTVRRLGGDRLRRYEVSYVVCPGLRSEFVNGEPPFHAVVEAYYDDRETCLQAWADYASDGELGRVIDRVKSRVAVVAEVVDLLA